MLNQRLFHLVQINFVMGENMSMCFVSVPGNQSLRLINAMGVNSRIACPWPCDLRVEKRMPESYDSYHCSVSFWLVASRKLYCDLC